MFKVPEVPNVENEIETTWWQACVSRRSSVLFYSLAALLVAMLVNSIFAQEPANFSWVTAVVSVVSVVFIYVKTKWRILEWEGKQGHIALLSFITAPHLGYLTAAPVAILADWGPYEPARVTLSALTGIATWVIVVAYMRYMKQLSTKIRKHRIKVLQNELKESGIGDPAEASLRLLVEDSIHDLRTI